MALATAQRMLHGHKQITATSGLFGDNQGYRELSELTEQAAKRAKVARLRELHMFNRVHRHDQEPPC